MLQRQAIKPATATETPSSIMASLSLYLIILAFFIMLNTISQREGSRTEGVLDSISSSFKEFPHTTIVSLEAADQGAGEDDAPGFEKSIEELFESAFPLAEIKVLKVLDQIEVTLPLDSMFESGGTGIRGKHEPVLDRLAELLSYQLPGKIHEVEALLSLPPRLEIDRADVNEPNDVVPLAVSRAGAMARELSARGVRASVIAIGIERRDPDTMRFLFVTRTADALDIEAGGKP